MLAVTIIELMESPYSMPAVTLRRTDCRFAPSASASAALFFGVLFGLAILRSDFSE